MKRMGLSLIAASILVANISSATAQQTMAQVVKSSVATSTSYDDIADAAFWRNPENQQQSLLAATLEGDGLAIYDHNGQEVFHAEGEEFQGADIRYGFTDTNGTAVDVLAVAMPDKESVAFFSIGADTQSPVKSLGTLAVDIKPEGVCLYKNITTGELTATVFADGGALSQYKLQLTNSGIASAITDDKGEPIAVRKVNVGGDISACVVDDQTATLYVAEQDIGIWAYGSDAENVKDRRLVDAVKPLGNLGEIEALDLVYGKNDEGYVIAADEVVGFNLYSRNNGNQYAGTFSVDGVDEAKGVTVGFDGLWVANTEADKPVYEKVTYAELSTSVQGWLPESNILSHTELAVQNVSLVKATGETLEVDDDGDAADDPAFWLNPEDASKSLIIATNKQGGLMAYDLDGNELQYLDEGEPNNVDIRQNVKDWNGETFSLAVATNRELNTITLYRIVAATDGQAPIQKLTAVGNNVHEESPELISSLGEVYGICLYQDKNGTAHVFANGKGGDVEHWQLTFTKDGVAGEIVRNWSLASQPEGCVADDETGTLYLGEEDRGIWIYNADAKAETKGTMMAEIDNKTLVEDVEGLTLYNNGIEKFLIASSQGNNTYVVYDIDNNHKNIGTFAIIGNDQLGVDGASDTDGIDVIPGNLSAAFPEGMFIAQDWYNIDGGYKTENQNFKLVSWKDIRQTLQP
ncbi:3-phytase [Veronia nyctiphanis]|uniref:3-phytase n=1 Tax=Veronia nyctiphanis TaxID=1278244 RepID=A0A4V1LTD3_9GAMM|nr:phytase [Veronia nyctiphanis]RXJ74798.1 3-phytase [Veronia nyctiphanis]